eukprot:CAMPEP_0176450656 /NCGR_PEP_ID=MMETSP0127-20121128/27283_1 /TAXON_ID=938130 /ORGANISM="Platyophrya macrostoma, Strain WH" /LENGTH=549 /DNA_ID=CAMNT_0017838387 /DNA_START=26 /DNA_END=1675 /DNA_ORIENTATION=-
MMIRVFRKAVKNLPDIKFASFSKEFRGEEPRQSSYASKKKRLRRELYENPEFDKAFPHLAENKPLTKISPKSKEPAFISSLLYQERVSEEKSFEENYFKNSQMFVSGMRSPAGPLKDMTAEAKEKVHSIIDMKLQQLEDTGLSREEVLYDNKQGGIPLKHDPFFQHIKNNRLAREILFAPNAEFTASKVVDIALRQDIGPDPSVAQDKIKGLYAHQMNDFHKKQLIKETNTSFKKFDSQRYFAQFDVENNPPEYDLVDHNNMTIPKPKSKYEIRSKGHRDLNWNDVHWRNTELLVEFLTSSGTLKNQFQNFLTKEEQRKIVKTIKQARHNCLLPTFGPIKPTDKKSLTTLLEDIEDHLATRINIETGGIYVKEKIGDSPIVEDAYMDEDPEDFDKNGFSQVQDLDIEFMPTMPNKEEIDIMKAQAYAKVLKQKQLETEGENIEELSKKAVKLEGAVNTEDIDLTKKKEELEVSFSKIENKLTKATSNDFARRFLGEKALSPDFVEEEQYIPEPVVKDQNLEKKLSQKSKQELLDEIANLRKQFRLTPTH